MMKQIRVLLFLFASLFILQACTPSILPSSSSSTSSKEQPSSTAEQLGTPTQLTFYIETELKDGYGVNRYMFNGFIGEDTLSFEMPIGHGSRKVYHPAEIGYKFTLKRIKNMQFEVVDFNRHEGFVILQMEVVHETN